MPGFEPGDVVRVPFPYTGGEARQHRTALVVAQTGPGKGSGLLLWVTGGQLPVSELRGPFGSGHP